MKTFNEFIEEITYIVEETTQERLDRIRRQRQIDARRGGYDVQRDRFSRTNPRQAAQNSQAAQRVKDMQRSLERGGWNPKPLEGNFRMPNEPLTPRATSSTFSPTTIGSGARLTGAAGAAGGAGLLSAAVPFAVGSAAAAAQGEIAQRQQVAATRRLTGALPGERMGLNPSLIRKDFRRDVIQDKGGAGGKVSTNTGYEAISGGRLGTLIRGSSGGKMLRVGERSDGRGLTPRRPIPRSVFNPNTWSKPETGTRYAATLGGHRGTVTYDSSGKRTFTRYIPNKK